MIRYKVISKGKTRGWLKLRNALLNMHQIKRVMVRGESNEIELELKGGVDQNEIIEIIRAKIGAILELNNG